MIDKKFWLWYYKCKVYFIKIERRDNLKNNLKNLRKQINITQDDLAYKLEVSRQTISSIENGRYDPSITLAFKISIFFGKKIEEIFIYED